MGDKKLLFIIAILILGVSFLGSTTPDFTGFDTAEATAAPISISLETTKFAPGSPITGTILLQLSGNLDPSEPITFSLGSETYNTTIEELLKQANFSLYYESTQFNATNAALSKSIVFTGAETKFIGLVIPRYAEVSDVSFSIQGAPISGISASELTMDVGNEGTIDWYYLGSFMDYNQTLIRSPDLDGSTESTGYIQPETYYCEFLTLPRTKDVTIAANYSKIGSDGDLQAVLLSVPTANPKIGWSGGSDTCDLPESGTNSCSIHLEYTIEGQYLACIYSEGTAGENLYQVPLDSSAETNTAYTCPTEQNSVCKETSFNNFFIYAQTGVYNNSVSGTIPLSDWETFTGSILTGIKYYVGSEPYNGLCKTTSCILPINLSSNTAGNITLSSLSLTYTYSGVTEKSNSWYDLVLPKADIIEIGNQTLENGATIEIPLETTKLTQSTLGDYSLQASFLGTTVNTTVSIVNASDIFDATTLIQTATTKLNTFLEKDSQEYKILSMIGKISATEKVVADLESYKNQIGFTQDAALVSEIESTLKDIPWEIISTKTKEENIQISKSDIPSTIGNSTEIESMQDAISVKGTLSSVTITTYSGEQSSYILLKKEITANTDISDATLYEIFPLPFANFLSTERPSSNSGNEAQYTLSLKKGETRDFYYLTTEAVSLSNFKSIIVLLTNETAQITSFCGDGFCASNENSSSCATDCSSGFNILYIIIPLGILLGISIVFFFIRNSQQKKKELRSTQDPLVNFLQKGTEKGIRKEQLLQSLRKKGWKEDAIQAALKKAKI